MTLPTDAIEKCINFYGDVCDDYAITQDDNGLTRVEGVTLILASAQLEALKAENEKLHTERQALNETTRGL